MKIAVCDDEEIARKNIAYRILQYSGETEVYTFSTGEEMFHTGIDFDIYYLDIEMKRLSGMKIAKTIREKQAATKIKKSIIIFVTAYQEYMEEAFDVNAYHYLHKPIEEKKFKDVLTRAMNESEANEKQCKEYLLVKTGGMQTKIFLKDILYMESNNKKIVIHMLDAKKQIIETYAKMEEMEQILKETFFRCHRCYLVNMEKIKLYNATTIQLISGDKLFLAQKKYPEFISKYLRYAKAGGMVNV